MKHILILIILCLSLYQNALAESIPQISKYIKNNDAKSIELMINNGADINIREPEKGFTPLMVAGFYGNTKIIRLLVESGADINAVSVNGVTVLMLTCISSNATTVEYLLKNGADPNIVADKGITALLITKINPSPEEKSKIESVLKRYGAK